MKNHWLTNSWLLNNPALKDVVAVYCRIFRIGVQDAIDKLCQMRANEQEWKARRSILESKDIARFQHQMMQQSPKGWLPSDYMPSGDQMALMSEENDWKHLCKDVPPKEQNGDT